MGKGSAGARRIEGDPMSESYAGQVRRQLREWTRDLDEKKIAGVCAGVSSQLDIPVTAVRAVFVLLALPSFSSVGIFLYLTLWFLMPASSGESSGLDRVVDAVDRLTGDSRHGRSGEEGSPRGHSPIHRDPL
jgi:phage shock protein PspC (stress-responsive transcriptional regulator)